jgi:VanZ family protein
VNNPRENLWIAASLAWIGVILFSSTSLAGAWSEAMFRSLAALFFGQVLHPGDSAYSILHVLADKGFHVTLFAVLAILLWNATQNSPRKVPLILLSGALLGSISEVLQSFFPGRDPAIHDVLINVGGTALGIGLIFLNRDRRQRTDESGVPAASSSGPLD